MKWKYTKYLTHRQFVTLLYA